MALLLGAVINTILERSPAVGSQIASPFRH